MKRTSFLIGMSAIAFAGAANAQNGQNNGDTTNASTGNRVVISCTVGNPANNCSVTQNAGTFNSTGSVNANGNGNTSTVTQTGNRLFAENRATGDRNSAVATQNGFNNTSFISQTGTIAAAGVFANSATVNQGTAGNNASGNNNIAEVSQARTAGAAVAAGTNTILVNQGTISGGNNNYAVATQSGTNNTSTITQQAAAGGTIASTFNTATVVQRSAGSSSTVTQRTSGNTARVDLFGGNNTNNNAPAPGTAATGANNSSVTQDNTLFQQDSSGAFTATAPTTTANAPRTQNSAIVAITGFQNNSTVSQNGVQNTADQSILNGGTGNTSLAGAGAPTNPGTGAAFPAGRPEGNSSTITQTGRGNYAATSIGGRVTTGGGSGNISTITQSQTSASVTATTLNSTQTASTAHRALVYQRGILDAVTINQTNNALGGGSAGAAGTVQSGSSADVSQLSFNSTTTVSQTGTNNALVTQGQRNETTGASNSIAITQVDQGDLTTTSGGNAGGGFGGGSAGTTTGTSRNSTEVVQYGISNSATVNQSAIAGSATVFQATGTRGFTANVQQGTQDVAANQVIGFSAEQTTAQQAAAANTFGTQNVVATVNQTAGQGGAAGSTATNVDGNAQAVGVTVLQSGRDLNATVNQSGGTATAAGTTQAASGNSNSSVLIGQTGRWNSASVTQSGGGQIATVEQRGGVGTGASATLRNLVTINQSNANNRALARQTSNVGASVAGDATAGVPNDVNFSDSRSGANSAEIAIIQSGINGTATVEQRGRGQLARLTQGGENNTAGILQDVGATNAVAVLTQTGNGNTYYITQTTAGQYVRVNQTGNGNAANGVSIINGPSGAGNNQAGTPTVSPVFGGVQ